MWRSILAVVAGYVLASLGIAALRGITAVLLRAFAAGGGYWIQLSYLLLKLVYTLVSAVLGGYFAAEAAGRKPGWHGLAVSVLLTAAFLASRAQYSQQPRWSFLSLIVLAWVGPLLGGQISRVGQNRAAQPDSVPYRAAKVLVGCFLIGTMIVNHFAPSSDLLLPSNPAQSQGMVAAAVMVCALGAWLIYSGLRALGGA